MCGAIAAVINTPSAQLTRPPYVAREANGTNDVLALLRDAATGAFGESRPVKIIERDDATGEITSMTVEAVTTRRNAVEVSLCGGEARGTFSLPRRGRTLLSAVVDQSNPQESH